MPDSIHEYQHCKHKIKAHLFNAVFVACHRTVHVYEWLFCSHSTLNILLTYCGWICFNIRWFNFLLIVLWMILAQIRCLLWLNYDALNGLHRKYLILKCFALGICCSFICWQLSLTNLAKINPTLINGEQLMDRKILCHNDVFTVADRSFRVELPAGSSSDRILQPVINISCRLYLTVGN